MSMPATSTAVSQPDALARRYQEVRQFSLQLCATLTPEDAMVQSMADASPTKWHLAHTTWFFETFLLSQQSDYRPFMESLRFLFNSYYNAVGKQFPRPQRGLLSRPSWDEVLAYREHVDRGILQLLDRPATDQQVADILTLGLHHEQQHQELLLTDIKHAFSCNPLLPAFHQADWPAQETSETSQSWQSFEGGLHWIGHDDSGFAFDNESPRHRVWLEPFQLSRRLVTCGEYLEFMQDGGYQRPELWLSEGWAAVNEHQWTAPLYWLQRDKQWYVFTLAGLQPLAPQLPVCHISYYEADAFATWSNARLPTEAQWEVASQNIPLRGTFVDQLLENQRPIHPVTDRQTSNRLVEMFGHVWQWTSSAYAAYPGYRPTAGALGEYNGKFMCNQIVLRGGSCATSSSHFRRSYRNFFPAGARWQFTGLRLAR